MAIYKSDIVDINLESGSIHRSFLKHAIGTADQAADRFGIRAFRDGQPVDLSGASCYGYFRNSHGTNIALTSNGTVSGNVAYVTLPQACYNYEGNFTLAVKLLVSGVTSTVRIIDGVVDNTNTGSAVAPTSAVPTYSEILSQYDAMVAATAVANGAIATTFNAATVYPAGSYVINDGALYRITADHAANVTWANTSKVATNFGAEVTALKSAIDEQKGFSDGRFDEIENVVDTFEELEVTYEIGGFNNQGQEATNSKRVRSMFIAVITDRIWKITVGSGIKYKLLRYSHNYGNANLIEKNFYHGERVISNHGSSTVYYRILAAYDNNADVSQASDIGDNIKVEKVIPYSIPEIKSDIQTNKDGIKLLDISNAETLPFRFNTKKAYVRYDTGAEKSGNTLTRWMATDFIDIHDCEYLVYSRNAITASSTDGGIAFYTSEDVSTYISGEPMITGAADFAIIDTVVKVPQTAKYVKMSANIEIGFYVKGIRSNPLKGLKLSLLGDSISSYKGYVPEGNDYYYEGLYHGIKDVNEMWWKVLCNNTGMIPLVIDAWSGSSICYNYATDSAHSDTSKIPMCSDLRTGRLASGGADPDIIIVTGGTNDWTYSKSTTTPLGNWNGRTAVDRNAVVSGQSTFMESYASMIDKLHENYPNAIVVCASMFFTWRGTDLGITRVNDMGYTESDYSDAVKKVCDIMGVPYIDIYNVGFNYENYYPTYCIDDEEEATHPKALGHAVIAKRFIDELPRFVQQFKS